MEYEGGVQYYAPAAAAVERPREKEVRKLQALLAEFLGTLFLTLTIILSANQAASPASPPSPGPSPSPSPSPTPTPTPSPGQGSMAAFVAVGCALGAMIYSFDHISGAHFNPAVTLGAVINRRLGIGAAILYVFAQTAGAVTGGLLAVAIAGPNNIDIRPHWSDISVGPAVAVEAIFTFALVLVMQNAAMEKNSREPNSYFGLAVSFTVLAGAKAVNAISGGCFNPSVGTGLQVASLALNGGSGSLGHIWIYWVAPFVGAVLATYVKIYMNLPSHQEVEGLPMVVPLTEMIGTYFVVLTAALTSEGLAVGAMLLAMVYMGDHVCGADYNPAVTLGVALRMSVPWREYWKVLVTVLAQFAGGFLAALTAQGVSSSGVQYPAGNAVHGQVGAFVFEALWTGLLVYVVCAVMTPTQDEDDGNEERKGHSRSYQGLAIGFVVAAGIYCGGQFGGGSGGVFNPAMGSSIMTIDYAFHSRAATAMWVYFAGPFVGSLLGAGAFTILHAHTDPVIVDYEVQVGGVDGTTMLAGATPGAPYLPAIYTPSNGYVG